MLLAEVKIGCGQEKAAIKYAHFLFYMWDSLDVLSFQQNQTDTKEEINQIITTDYFQTSTTRDIEAFKAQMSAVQR